MFIEDDEPKPQEPPADPPLVVEKSLSGDLSDMRFSDLTVGQFKKIFKEALSTSHKK